MWHCSMDKIVWMDVISRLTDKLLDYIYFLLSLFTRYVSA